MFNVAKRLIEDLGGKATKSVSGKTDYVAVQEKMSEKLIFKKPRDAHYHYMNYCKDQTSKRETIAEYDEKRRTKGRPEICVIFEGKLYEWLLKATQKMTID